MLDSCGTVSANAVQLPQVAATKARGCLGASARSTRVRQSPSKPQRRLGSNLKERNVDRVVDLWYGVEQRGRHLNPARSARSDLGSHPAVHGRRKVRGGSNKQRLRGFAHWDDENCRRNRAITGRRGWRMGFFRSKSDLGGRLKGSNSEAEQREAAIGCHTLNRMAALGKPTSEAVGS